jgi:hypothetical protein
MRSVFDKYDDHAMAFWPQDTTGTHLMDEPAGIFGTYHITGANASLIRGRVLNQSSGSYGHTGANASLIRGRVLNQSPSSYDITGVDASLIRGRVLNAASGSYSTAGADIGRLATRVMSANPATLEIIGKDATLIPDYPMNAAPETYGIIGKDITPIRTIIMRASPGDYNLSIKNTTELAARILPVDSTTYEITGSDATLDYPDPSYGEDSDCILYHAYWDGTANDYSSYGNDGTKVGTNSSFGTYGLSITGTNLFPGGPEEGVHVPYSSSLGFTDTFSYEGWIFFPPSSGGTWLSQGDLLVLNKLAIGTGFYFGFTTSDLAVNYVLPTGTFSGNTWYHIVFVYDSVSHTGKVYINTVDQSFDEGYPFTPPTLALVNNSSMNINIGSGKVGDNYSFDLETIGEIRIWKKVLSQSDVTSIFNATKGRYGL